MLSFSNTALCRTIICIKRQPAYTFARETSLKMEADNSVQRTFLLEQKFHAASSFHIAIITKYKGFWMAEF